MDLSNSEKETILDALEIASHKVNNFIGYAKLKILFNRFADELDEQNKMSVTEE